MSNTGKWVGEDPRRNHNAWGKEAIIQMEIITVQRRWIQKKSKKELKWLEWRLRFYVNGQITRSTIENKESKYHLAVTISEKGQKIELLNFESE